LERKIKREKVKKKFKEKKRENLMYEGEKKKEREKE